MIILPRNQARENDEARECGEVKSDQTARRASANMAAIGRI